MAHKGQILVNPENGDSFEFIETSKDTNGEKVTIKSVVKSKGMLVPNHIHVLQDERFEILSGTMTYLSEGKMYEAKAGAILDLPKSKPHNHFNNQDSPLEYIHTVSPALDFEHFIENPIGLAQDGKFKNGKAGLVQELVSLKYLDSKAYLADLPIGIQKLLMNAVAPIARRFGYRAIYKKYSGFEK